MGCIHIQGRAAEADGIWDDGRLGPGVHTIIKKILLRVKKTILENLGNNQVSETSTESREPGHQEIFRKGISSFSLHEAMKATTQRLRDPAAGNRFFLWLFGALVLSLVVHLFLFRTSESLRVGGFSPESYDTIVPRTFRMKRVEIDPATLKEEPAPPAPPERKPVTIPVPEEAISATVSSRTTTAGNSGGLLPAPLPLDKEQPGDEGKKEGEKNALWAEPLSASPSGPRLDDLLAKEGKNAFTPDPLKDLPMPGAGGKEGTGETPASGFSSLDNLLEGGTQLTQATAPILMPTDLLFEYDSATLRPEAAQSLEKLALLAQRHPSTMFRIEGHTDSFGSVAYNQDLSLRRAESVKEWMTSHTRIDPSRITTRGYGSTRLLVPATATMEAQGLNRRVEIVITRGDTAP